MTVDKRVEKARRDGLESPLRGRGIEGADVDQVDLMGTECLGAAENLGDIESRLEVIEHHNEGLLPRLCEEIALPLLGIPP